jgi:nicotinamide riboside transporter PnuC
MRSAGVSISVVAFALLLYTSLASPAYAKAHPQLNPAIVAEYSRPWPVALACTVVLAGIMLALVPLRRGEQWALWTSFAMWIILLLTRLATDPRCMVVLDPHQHGCHSFMIAMVLGVIGLALAR